ncbi:MAG: LLM class flavin-dependent oxidoreductase, partial [Halioglobus sp.]|nr:LLM class flavin-dependent oxidoreductase [Halioglobus sp.]
VMTATGLDDESMEAAIGSARNQIAFYASTPAYLPVLECHGWEALQPEALQLTREGKWVELANLVDDDMLHTFAVVGSPAEVATKLVERYTGKADRISPVVYQPDLKLLAALRSELTAAL